MMVFVWMCLFEMRGRIAIEIDKSEGQLKSAGLSAGNHMQKFVNWIEKSIARAFYPCFDQLVESVCSNVSDLFVFVFVGVTKTTTIEH